MNKVNCNDEEEVGHKNKQANNEDVFCVGRPLRSKLLTYVHTFIRVSLQVRVLTSGSRPLCPRTSKQKRTGSSNHLNHLNATVLYLTRNIKNTPNRTMDIA